MRSTSIPTEHQDRQDRIDRQGPHSDPEQQQKQVGLAVESGQQNEHVHNDEQQAAEGDPEASCARRRPDAGAGECLLVRRTSVAVSASVVIVFARPLCPQAPVEDHSGTLTLRRISARICSALMVCPSCTKLLVAMRWAQTGTNSDLMSSGTT